MKYLGTKNIETERLFLRKVRKEDYIEAYQHWCSRDEVVKYLLWPKHQTPEETLKQYEEWANKYDDPKTFRWIVGIKGSNELIGIIDVAKSYLRFGTCEVSYCYGDKYWHKGYATEALKAVINYLFEECEAETIFAEYMSNNKISGKVMASSGLKYEGTLRSRVIDKDGLRNDLISYSITRNEYKK